MQKQIKLIALSILLIIFPIVFNFYVASRGVFHVDTFIHFDNAFRILEGDLPVKEIKCFTTRPDTLFGFSFLALSVDHEISNYFKNDTAFQEFKAECSKTCLLYTSPSPRDS